MRGREGEGKERRRGEEPHTLYLVHMGIATSLLVAFLIHIN